MSSLTLADLRQRLDQVPRLPLGLWPTPLHEAPRLARALGGPRLFFKREDLCGLALGGNKIRHLEYILPDALASGADTLVLGERFVSNYGAQMAAATQLVGLRSVIVSCLAA